MTSPPLVQSVRGTNPVRALERVSALDILRGLALFGVLIVNLLTFFRVSLFDHILLFHTHPGWANHAVDFLVAFFFDTKAVTLFCLLFGIGVGIQLERAAPRNFTGFLLRRFSVLLGFGIFHTFLLSNVDILCLYSLSAFLLIPFLSMSEGNLAWLGCAIVALSFGIDCSQVFPSRQVLQTAALAATRVYGSGSFLEILAFRWKETWELMFLFDLMWLPRSFGLMMLGVAAWRTGFLKNLGLHRPLFKKIALFGGLIGGIATAIQLCKNSSSLPIPFLSPILDSYSFVPLAFSYGALVFLKLDLRSLNPVAALGQMALTNYLMQSLILGFVFYGYGLGLFGLLAPAVALPIGLIIYAGQIVFSVFWLRRFQYGPAEWLWRSLTYNKLQPFRRQNAV